MSTGDGMVASLESISKGMTSVRALRLPLKRKSERVSAGDAWSMERHAAQIAKGKGPARGPH